MKGGTNIQALILGGTRGLGREIAISALQREITPIVVGRTASEVSTQKDLEGSVFINADLSNYIHIVGLVEQLKNPESIGYVFWVSGIGLQGRLVDQSPDDIWKVFNTVAVGPLLTLQAFMQKRVNPFHLVSVASTSASKIRKEETAYGMAKSAQAQGTRNLHQELVRDFPGSKSTLVLPGGMNTPFWEGSEIDSSKFMDPTEVAEIIWKQVLDQEEDWCEMHINRDSEGKPVVEFGPKVPSL